MVLAMLIDFCHLETAEEADSREKVEVDQDHYPQLSENICELHLQHQKAILHQYMAVARHKCHWGYVWQLYFNIISGYYKLSGRTPWMDIVDNPSNHLSKWSQPDTDHNLQEPLHMKSDGVDIWLKHWLKLQKKNKHPLVLKGLLDNIHESSPTLVTNLKLRSQHGKAWYLETDRSDCENVESILEDNGIDGGNAMTADGITDKAEEVVSDAILPQSPYSTSNNRKAHHTFLTSLSADLKYQQLLLLLHVAKVSDLQFMSTSTNKLPGWWSIGRFPPSVDYLGFTR